ncbi:hypothetical protein BU24DRAFT_427930 [Aaosphaeria arxii CBS 175.79]|uniref:F-box domain-containing protein n=1 Tax=Aaosphaeria arxii CBS 175.79 TaxID=1450172 RepID=A0A6A5XA15_9PLEO|nr:uncharacterized protein BU24DRAFT_427930 [Aaosphaeria arxii CBS 175.79]KAF2009895.1 hypothetical protein BU24DRAFT_427930 [Aaosphaeria arxii CBS 175.79]
MQTEKSMFSVLPTELFLSVLDELIRTRSGKHPVAFPPSDQVTKTLRALTLTSKDIYPIASEYLYTHCVWLGNNKTLELFARTLGIDLPASSTGRLCYGSLGHSSFFRETKVFSHITSMYLSPFRPHLKNIGVRISHFSTIVDLLRAVSSTIKTLYIDFQPDSASYGGLGPAKTYPKSSVLREMHNLEELVISWDYEEWFSCPPPNVKRLAISTRNLVDGWVDWLDSTPRLEILVGLSAPGLSDDAVKNAFAKCSSDRRAPLDIVFAGISWFHSPVKGDIDWKDTDPIRYWEVDIPVSYYGDEKTSAMCERWIWENGLRGSLFNSDKSLMMTENQERRVDDAIYSAGFV